MAKKTENNSVKSINARALEYYDMDQLSDVVKGASFEIEQLENGNFHADLFSAAFIKGGLDRGRYNRTTLTKGVFSEEYMTFGFLLDAHEETCFNGKTLQKYDMMLGNENLTVDYYLPPDSTWTTFQVKRDDLYKTNIILPHRESIVYILDKKIKSTFARKVSNIFALVEGMSDNPDASPNSELIYNYLLSLYAYAIDQGSSCVHLKRNESLLLARKIYAYLHEHAAEPVQMIHLTHLTGKSERSIERIFKKHFGISPHSYLKLHRLHLIRHKLMEQNRMDPSTITSIAMDNGFMHMGYFGSEYKKLFNEMPSETLKHHNDSLT